MCIRDSIGPDGQGGPTIDPCGVCEPCVAIAEGRHIDVIEMDAASNTGVDDVREIIEAVSYTHLRAHETVLDLVCRFMLDKKKKKKLKINSSNSKNKKITSTKLDIHSDTSTKYAVISSSHKPTTKRLAT